MRPAWILFGALFCANLGFAMLAPVLPSLMRELGLTELQGGLLLSGSAVMWVIFSPWWGRRSDRWGRKPVVMVGLAGYALGAGAFALVIQAGLDGVYASALVTWLLLVGTRLIIGAMFSAAVPGAQAYIADVSSGQQRTSALGILSSSIGLGSILGPALGALVVSLGMSLVAPLFLSSFTPFFGLLLVWRLLPPVRPALQQDERAPSLSALDARLLPFLVIGFCALLVISLVQFTLGYLVQDRFGLDAVETTRQTGLAVMVSGVALFITQMVLIQVFRLTPMKLLRLGMPLVLAALLLLAVSASQLQLMLAMVLMGLGIGMIQPGYRSAITFAVEPYEQGTAAGLASAVSGYGFIIGPALGTALYGLNPFSPYILAALVVLAGLVVLVLHPSTRVVQAAT